MTALGRFARYLQIKVGNQSLSYDSFETLKNASPVSPTICQLNTQVSRCCSKCGKDGSYIASELGKEKRLCFEHSEEFDKEHNHLDLFYFCLYQKWLEIFDLVPLRIHPNVVSSDLINFDQSCT